MAKREPLFEVDLGENGGLLRLWDAEHVEQFIRGEQEFWRSIHDNNMTQPFYLVSQRLSQLTQRLQQAVASQNLDTGLEVLRELYASDQSRIPWSKSPAAQGIKYVLDTYGRDAARGAVTATLPHALWDEGIGGATRPFLRGLIEQIVYENGLTRQSIEAAKRTLNALNGRASQVMAGVEDRANNQAQEIEDRFEAATSTQAGRSGELERKWLSALNQFAAQSSELSSRLEATHHAYVEQMRLKAPVEYWRSKADQHAGQSKALRNWLAGFFVVTIGIYLVAFGVGHGQIAAFLLQFEGSTGALLVISAIFALLASLPLWIGRLLVKFYLSEHHLATDAREREIMTQTYLALTAEGVVDEKDRTLILGALFRSTPDGVIKDNSQPDTSPAAMLSKLLDSR